VNREAQTRAAKYLLFYGKQHQVYVKASPVKPVYKRICVKRELSLSRNSRGPVNREWNPI